MIKLIIFDADYTLYEINKTNAYTKLYDYLSRELKISLEEIIEEHKNIIEKLKDSSNPIKRNHSYSIKLLLEKYPADNKERILGESVKIFWNQIIEDLIIIPEVIEILKRLKENFKLIIASDEFRDILEKKLEKVFGDWKQLFEILVTPEVTKTMKPSEKYYKIILNLTGLRPEETVMIGDSWERDLAPANSIGIKTILFSKEKRGTPDFWIKRFGEVLQLDLFLC